MNADWGTLAALVTPAGYPQRSAYLSGGQMTSEGDLGLEPETILDLPIESLALAVLQNFAQSGSWNRDNWMLGAQTAVGAGPHLDALAEVWAWLESRALLAPSPSQSSPEARIVTRAGSRALESGSLTEIQAAERIGLELPGATFAVETTLSSTMYARKLREVVRTWIPNDTPLHRTAVR